MIRRTAMIVVAVMIMAGMATATASAASGPTADTPFSGAFRGRIFGDNGSQAPLTLVLTQVGDEVTGTAYLGRGLYVDGGFCGSTYIPASVQSAAGDVTNNREIEAAVPVTVSGFNVNISLDGELSRDGQTLDGVAKIDLPWLCGGRPDLEHIPGACC